MVSRFKRPGDALNTDLLSNEQLTDGETGFSNDDRDYIGQQHGATSQQETDTGLTHSQSVAAFDDQKANQHQSRRLWRKLVVCSISLIQALITCLLAKNINSAQIE